MTIPRHQNWLKQTTAFRMCGKEPEALDQHLLCNGRATLDYGRECEVNEIRVALEACEAKVGKHWNNSLRNKPDAFKDLDSALRKMGCDEPNFLPDQTCMTRSSWRANRA